MPHSSPCPLQSPQCPYFYCLCSHTGAGLQTELHFGRQCLSWARAHRSFHSLQRTANLLSFVFVLFSIFNFNLKKNYLPKLATGPATNTRSIIISRFFLFLFLLSLFVKWTSNDWCGRKQLDYSLHSIGLAMHLLTQLRVYGLWICFQTQEDDTSIFKDRLNISWLEPVVQCAPCVRILMSMMSM